MIKNYLTVAWRNFRNGKIYSFINVAGLAIGIACSIVIYLYITYELSYDRFHSRSGRIYRVNEFFEGENGTGERSSSIPFPMADALALDYSNSIEQVVRFFDFQSPVLTVAYEPKEKTFNERNFFFVDSSYSKVFDLDLIKGNPQTALNDANTVVISESAARKYFEGEDAIGKLLLFQDETSLLVTGVFEDMPANSHFHADFLCSFETLKSFYNGQYPANWHWNPCWTYLLLKENADPAQLVASFPEFVNKHIPAHFRDDVRLDLQKMTDIHLLSNLEFEIEANGSKNDIYLFAGIAVFVLVIACINFMNLSTARSMKRAKEVGMRKAIGGQKYQLVFQFMMESVLIVFVALVFALGLVAVAFPVFNEFTGRNLILNVADPELIGGLLFTGLFLGISSGVYPAIVLTSFKPVDVLKSRQVDGQGLTFRKALVVLQFVISLVLIICTGVAVKQVGFLQSSTVGFTKDHIVMIPVIRSPIAPKYRTFVEESMTYSGVESVTAIEEIIGAKHQGGNFQFEGMEKAELFSRLKVRHDFLKTFNIPLLAGRDYSIDAPTDDTASVVVNETLVKGFGWTAEQSIGKRCTIGRFHAQIIGVTKDFNFSSKHEPVAPLVMEMNNRMDAFNLSLKYMVVRINPATTQKSLEELEALWKKLLPGRPFEYFFLDNELNNLYQSEANLITISTTFSVLAIVVACLGLFGLASFNAEQRKKEISIRKVLGSSVGQIIFLILGDYSKLLLVAIVLACPLAWFAMHNWLTTFAYRIDIPLGIFLASSVATIAIALFTVSYKSFSVARSNPVDSLRSE